MSANAPEAPKPYAPWAQANAPVEHAPDPVEQVSRLETWPPVAQAAPVRHAQDHPVRTGAWVCLVIGLFIPLVALITGLWALGKAREGDRQCLAI